MTIQGLEAPATISIYDLNGRLLKQTSLQTDINIAELNSGIHLVQIHTQDGVISKRLVKGNAR